MCLAGHKFYKAQGEIWLTDAIDIRFITPKPISVVPPTEHPDLSKSMKLDI
jgi:RNA:NAD 2'-phosphotransferase (TPT1/KptA family)